MADENSVHDVAGDEAATMALYEKVMQCEPVIDPSTMEQWADLVFSKERVIRNWRIAALFASKDGAFFRELATDAGQAELLAPVVCALNDAADLLREMARIMDAVSARIAAAGCNHPGFNEWMEADTSD